MPTAVVPLAMTPTCTVQGEPQDSAAGPSMHGHPAAQTLAGGPGAGASGVSNPQQPCHPLSWHHSGAIPAYGRGWEGQGDVPRRTLCLHRRTEEEPVPLLAASPTHSGRPCAGQRCPHPCHPPGAGGCAFKNTSSFCLSDNKMSLLH